MIPLDRLIVVAGPSCCGKSTFINKFRNGEFPELASFLNIGDISDWTYVDAFYMNAKMLREIEESPAMKMLLHWTIPHPTLKLMLRDIFLLFSPDKKERLTLLHTSKELTVLTLYTSQYRFLQNVESRRNRARERRREGLDSFINLSKKMWYTGQLRRLYSDTRKLAPLYARWFKLCRSLGVMHASYLINVSDEPVLESIEKWPEILDKFQKKNP